MLSLFKSLFGKSTPTVASADQRANRRMTLEQRQAFRREMLYQSIRESFLSMEVLASMYKFKVMPVDARHHRFIAMIDVAKSFVTGRDAKTKSFAAMEKTMRQTTYNRFGILIVGTYWRVSETESQFERKVRATDASDSAIAAAIQSRTDVLDKPPVAGTGGFVMARETYMPVSPEETAAFMAALRDGVPPPVVHVGDMEYQSDLAPLDGGIMIGGTQYGKLD
jgi:hypothetical protein